MELPNNYSAFENQKLLFQGPLSEVVLKIKKRLGRADNSNILMFCDHTGQTMDFNFQGSEKDVEKRLEVYVTANKSPDENQGPGRPKLGVVSREISLLPRHWEWLATQPGGASASLRRLVDEAKKKSSGSLSIKQAQERTHKFMSAIAGDLKGYEEALRALYKKDESKFRTEIKGWPEDIQKHATALARPVFSA